MQFSHLGTSFFLFFRVTAVSLNHVDRSASLEYATIWIMSQRILLHLRGACLTTLVPGHIDLGGVNRGEGETIVARRVPDTKGPIVALPAPAQTGGT